MARSSGRSSARGSSRSSLRNPPRQVNRAPPPAPRSENSGGSFLGGLGATVAQGLAFGTGSAVAHRAVDAVVGPRTIQHENIGSEAAVPATYASNGGSAASCQVHQSAFMDCLTNYGNEISKCQFYMDMLSECKKNSGSMLSTV